MSKALKCEGCGNFATRTSSWLEVQRVGDIVFVGPGELGQLTGHFCSERCLLKALEFRLDHAPQST